MGANAESAYVLVRHRNEDLPDSSVLVHRSDRSALLDPWARPSPRISSRILIPHSIGRFPNFIHSFDALLISRQIQPVHC